MRIATIVVLFIFQVSLWGITGCSDRQAQVSAEAHRKALIDKELATLSPALAIMNAYAIHSATEACRFADIPASVASDLVKRHSDNTELTDVIAEYKNTLDGIYREERGFCTAYRMAVSDSQEITMAATKTSKVPNGLHVFYAGPTGIMRDVRASEHRDLYDGAPLSVDVGFEKGEWLGFKIAEQGELAVGLFASLATCQDAQTVLNEAGTRTQECRNWSSEPSYGLAWDP